MTGLGWARDELAAWEAAGLLRIPRVVESASAPEVEIDGQRVVLLCSNNYLGLASDPRVRAAAAAASLRWGAGAGASRLVSGTQGLHASLERDLAALEGAEDCVLFSSGYLANIGVISTLTGPEDVVLSDELNHASIVDACRLSRARVEVYRHGDIGHLESMVAASGARRRVVVTDTVFSMDGDVAPLEAIAEVCERHDAICVVDEAHATGVLGPHGGGAVEELGLVGRVPVVVGTLSKSFGSAGGYVATTRDVATLIRNRARTHVFDTAPAPAAMAAASAALRIVGAEPWRRERARGLARRLADGLRDLGYEVGEPGAAIVPVVIGDARRAVELSERLLDAGVFCPAIRPPSVPEGTSRLRATVMATHTDEHIALALDAFAAAASTAPRVRSSATVGVTKERMPRRRDVFVTGTDTGVGKTVVTAAIAANLTRQGLSVAVFKPLQTGTIDGADDARWVARVAGCDAHVGFALPDPLAPSVAAERSGETIDLAAIVDRYEELKQRYDAVVVEGAGGLLVPIVGDVTMAELAAALRLPVVVVARPALGTLNHTALAVEVARARGLDVAGIVISGLGAGPTLAERTNPAELEKIAPLVGVVPSLDGVDTEGDGFPATFDATSWLDARFGGTFDAPAFIASLDARADATT